MPERRINSLIGGANIDLSIIVISYNTKELTLHCLRSVFDQTEGISFEVIVLDNNSSDGSAEAIEHEFPNARLIASNENFGFAKGNNIAVDEAEGAYILLLNPDTVVLNGAIQKLLAFARKKPDARIWGGRTLFGDGSLNPASCWRRLTLWSLFCYAFALTWAFRTSAVFNAEGYGGWNRDSVKCVDIVSGCFFMIKKDFWRELSGFSPKFFMYGEEADLCLRAGKFNAKPMVTPEATIIHYGGASEKVRADKVVRLFAAKALLIKRHWNTLLIKPGLILLTLWPLVRVIIFTAKSVAGNNKKVQDEKNTWNLIWRQRKQWLK